MKNCLWQALASGHTETDSLDLRCDAVRHGHLSAGVAIPCLSNVPILMPSPASSPALQERTLTSAEKRLATCFGRRRKKRNHRKEHQKLPNAKIIGHNHVKSLAGLSVTHRSQSVATAFTWNRVRPGSIAKDISPNANILGFGGWHRVSAISESMRAASRATRPFCIRLHWHVYGTTIPRGRSWCGLPVQVGMRRRTRRSPPRQLINVRTSGRASPLFGGLPRVGLTQTRSCLTCCFASPPLDSS